MRIVSSYKDYYDGMLAHDQDYETLFVRETKTTTEKGHISYHIPIGIGIRQDDRYYDEQLQLIGFCGKYYIRLTNKVTGTSGYVGHPTLDRVLREIPESTERWNSKYNKSNRTTYVERYKKLALNHLKTTSVDHLFEKCHYFVVSNLDRYDHYEQTIYPILHLLGFPKIKPVHDAYQDLLTWIYNKAVPFKPIPEVSNKDLITAKGFNQHSFRKEKDPK